MEASSGHLQFADDTPMAAESVIIPPMLRKNARNRRLPARRALWVLALVLFPLKAHADAGVPMLPFAYPVILLFLLPVIGIEVLYLRAKLKTSWRATLSATTKANLVTMLLGYPLAWLVFFALEMLLWLGLTATGVGDRIQWGPGHAIAKLIVVATSAAWMRPVNDRWAIPFAFVVLLIPSFVLSGFVESRLLDRYGWLRCELPCARAVWQANVLSYVFLAGVGSFALWGFLHLKP
ncbi:MAG TPA: hypothetical protein VGS10_16130 [Terracidiphilus sp.]|nr:hypothetical protein [Terracidiphilus sp.]